MSSIKISLEDSNMSVLEVSQSTLVGREASSKRMVIKPLPHGDACEDAALTVCETDGLGGKWVYLLAVCVQADLTDGCSSLDSGRC